MSEADSARDAEVGMNTPGRQLAAARESCGLTVADIARQLKLSSRQIEALETGNYARLPGTVFVRGFIRNYARLVKLDAAPLLEYTERQLRPVLQPAPELTPPVDIPFSNGRESRWRNYGLAALVLLIPMVFFGSYYDESPESPEKSRQIELPPPQVMTGDAVAAAAQTQFATASDAGPEPAPQPALIPKSEQNPPEKPTQGERSAVASRPGEHRVRLRFERESWVEIRDRHGRKIFSQFNPAGTDQAVSGTPPLTLIVGNAAGVRLTHNDQPVDLVPHIKVDVARLTLE